MTILLGKSHVLVIFLCYTEIKSNERKIPPMKKWLMRILFLILFLSCCIVLFFFGKGYMMYRKAVDDISIAQKVDEIRAKESYTTLDELPGIYLDAVISVEDRRFYSHSGFDWIATGRAVINDIRTFSFAEGGSTITQQLAKNMYFTQEKRIERKIAELFVAFDLERNYSKEEILELYVNSIYFGNGYDSIREASEGYFQKSPSKMTDFESTLLAGIPNAPSAYALTKNPELARQRQRQVLKKMVEHGVLTEAEADKIESSFP